LLGADVVDMLGVVGRDEVSSVLDALREGSAQSLLQRAAELAERGADFADVLKGLMEALHELSVQAALGQNSGDFSPEELQLYYQIALIGNRDLFLAPDDRSGFEMTLLRMLTFAPEPGSSVQVRSINDSVDSDVPRDRDDASDADKAEDRNDTSIASDQVRNEIAQLPTADTDVLQQRWFELVERLPASGVTRMIADNSVLLLMQLPKVDILLDEGHDTLLTSNQTQNLSRALEQVLGDTVELDVSTGNPEVETPAVRRARETRQRQEEAEMAIAGDATVNGLLAEFDGRVDRVRPV
jgi:DNA polymerase-3 subunit gamma/tau